MTRLFPGSSDERPRRGRRLLLIAMLILATAGQLGIVMTTTAGAGSGFPSITSHALPSMQSSGTGSLKIEQFNCPPWIDIDANTPIHAYVDTCGQVDTEPLTFTATDGSGYMQSLAGDPDDFGQEVTFKTVPAGVTLAISVSIPAGFGPPAYVGCDGNERPVFAGNRFTWEVRDGTTARCWVFNMYEDPWVETVSITSFWCERGVGPDRGHEELVDGCPFPLDGVTFHVRERGGSSRSGTTGADGHVKVSRIYTYPNEAMELTGEIRAPHVDAVVFCDSEGAGWGRMESTAGAITFPFSAANSANQLECVYFFVQEGPYRMDTGLEIPVTPIDNEQQPPAPVSTPALNLPPTPEIVPGSLNEPASGETSTATEADLPATVEIEPHLPLPTVAPIIVTPTATAAAPKLILTPGPHLDAPVIVTPPSPTIPPVPPD